jgi:uncharacterized protein (DUF1015 family)
MKILSFTGLRYTDAAGDLDRLTAPPFDQIDEALRERLYARSDRQFARLTRPVSEQGPEAAQEQARLLHQAWRTEGAIAADSTPSLYPYGIELDNGTARRGLACLVDVSADGRTAIRPHELTVAKPLQDRLALLETLRIDLEPVMIMCDDGGSLETMLKEDLSATEPLENVHQPETGGRHRLHRISDPARIASYRETLDAVSAVIADGHHRTKVAQLFVDKHSPAPGTAACAKLAVLMSLASEDLVIDPIHRAVVVPVDRERLEALVAERTPWDGSDGAAFATAVAEAPAPALGVRFRGAAPEIWRLDRDRVPAGTPGGDTALPAVLLHHQLLPASGLEIESATDGSIEYRSNPHDLWRLCEDGECEAGFWLPPMAPADFAAATEGGDVLPPKSTRFLPKLVSGLVWSAHDGRVG